MQQIPSIKHIFKSLLLVTMLAAFFATPALAENVPVPATEGPAKVAQKQVASVRPDVNVNKASAGELSEALVGVGAAKAKAIVDYRQKHGAFKSLDDLAQVKGIGPSILSKNKAHIRFN